GRRIRSGKKAALAYLTLRLGSPVPRRELELISGISEWARRLRELRVQEGWPIVTVPGVHSSYRLADIRPAPDVSRTWREVNSIRRSAGTPGDRMLELLRRHLRTPISAEQLSYVAKDQHWKDHLLRLRSETGLRISSKADRPDLEDSYLLESEEPLPDPDEWDTPESLRAAVLDADGRRCTSCGWEQDSTPDKWLDVHRRSPGSSLKDFATLCNECHERLH